MKKIIGEIIIQTMIAYAITLSLIALPPESGYQFVDWHIYPICILVFIGYKLAHSEN